MSSQARAHQRWIDGNPPSLLGRQPARSGRQRSVRRARKGALHPSPVSAEENWKRDEHWAAVTAYLAGMYFPSEG